jgi:hypothetical protein
MIADSTEPKTIKTRVGLLELARHLGNVSQACKLMGYSRDSFYRFREVHASGGELALNALSRRRPSSRIRIPMETETAAVEMALQHPGWGQYRAAGELSKHGQHISPGGVRGIWVRHHLETMKKRLEAVNARHDGPDVTDHTFDVPPVSLHEELEESPGYCCAQAVYCVGTLKGLGQIFQQTFIDTYSNIGFAALYPQDTPIAGVDFLNQRVFPFFEQQGVALRQIVTDCGPDYCGMAERHPYELCLALQNIHHIRTTEKSTMCEAFHATLLREFYGTIVQQRSYATLQQVQRDLDMFIDEYNFRSYAGGYCCGRTPMQTFRANILPFAAGPSHGHGAHHA